MRLRSYVKTVRGRAEQYSYTNFFSNSTLLSRSLVSLSCSFIVSPSFFLSLSLSLSLSLFLSPTFIFLDFSYSLSFPHFSFIFSTSVSSPSLSFSISDVAPMINSLSRSWKKCSE